VYSRFWVLCLGEPGGHKRHKESFITGGSMKELLVSETNVGASSGRSSNRSHPDWLKTMELGSLTHP
jgi:hypothetical protein